MLDKIICECCSSSAEKTQHGYDCANCKLSIKEYIYFRQIGEWKIFYLDPKYNESIGVGNILGRSLSSLLTVAKFDDNGPGMKKIYLPECCQKFMFDPNFTEQKLKNLMAMI